MYERSKNTVKSHTDYTAYPSMLEGTHPGK